MIRYATLFQSLITSILLIEQLAHAAYISNEWERGLDHTRRQSVGDCSLQVTVTKVFVLIPVGQSERGGFCQHLLTSYAVDSYQLLRHGKHSTQST